MRLSRLLFRNICDFCFPSFCLLCQTKGDLLCKICFERIEIASCTLDSQEETAGFTVEKAAPLQLLCKESESSSYLQQMIASLMTVQLCQQSWPGPDLLVPFSIQQLDAAPIARAISNFFSIKSCVLFKKKGILSDSEYTICPGSEILLTKDICVVSLLALGKEQRQHLTSLLKDRGVKGVYFLSFLGA